ncbi:MAG: phage tail protein, partial [Thermoplasmata archaeon]|nr:phage tail protein [Thermoplasmata archaeon]
NLYQTLPITYKDMGTFATGAIFLEEDFDNVFRTYPLPIGSYMLANDAKLQVKVFAREFRMTVRQVVERFGMPDGPHRPIEWTNISDQVRRDWESGLKERWVDIGHYVGPNPDFDPTRLESEFKMYESVYYELGTAHTSGTAAKIQPGLDDRLLRVRGYDFFPVLAPRWEITGEDVYGTDCPGMTVLGDIKQLQLGEKRGLQALEKIVNPPTTGPSSLKSRSPSILPGAVTYNDVQEGQKGFRAVHEVDPRVLELENKQKQVRDRIRSGYFVDLFLSTVGSDRREVTAREIQERHDEKLPALGSVLERLNQDLLKPLIDIVFNIMLRQGMIPPAPPEIHGLDFDVEYISILAQAQKLAGLASIERFVAFIVQLAETKPEALDKLDVDEVINRYADIVGVPANIVLSDDAAAATREQRARALQAKEAAETALTMARATKNFGESKIEGDTVLGRVDEAVGAAA